MFGIFKKKARKAVVEVKKMENRDAVEATVWGAYSIAYADGTCDAKEIGVLEKQFQLCQPLRLLPVKLRR